MPRRLSGTATSPRICITCCASEMDRRCLASSMPKVVEVRSKHLRDWKTYSVHLDEILDASKL